LLLQALIKMKKEYKIRKILNDKNEIMMKIRLSASRKKVNLCRITKIKLLVLNQLMHQYIVLLYTTY